MADGFDGRGYRLVFEGDGRSIDVDDPIAHLGRHSDCTVVVTGDGVSRRHATILRSADGWRVQDRGSENGTWVNGESIVSTDLEPGDVIALGTTRIRFERRTARTTRVRFSQDQAGPLSAYLSLPDSPTANAPTGDDGSASDWGLDLVNRAARSLLLEHTLDETLERIMDLVFERLPAERGCICLVDAETGQRDPRVMRTQGDGPGDIAISESIVEHAIGGRKAVLVRDAPNDPRFHHQTSIKRAGIGAAMCAPMIHEGQVHGFLYVDVGSARVFQRRQLEAFAALAVLSGIGVHQVRLRDRAGRERSIRQRLERYSSPAVVDAIVASGGDRSGDGATVDASILFADLGGFTSFSEQASPTDVIALLNDVFARLTDAVFAFDGTLDKFTGDGLMAVFGAPLADPDHARHAVEAAIQMMRTFAEFRAASTLDGSALALRIGINSGSVVAGDVGSAIRKDYTVIGDAVNVASRLESQVASDGEIVIGPSTRAHLGAETPCEALEPRRLKGKAEPVTPYRVAWTRVRGSEDRTADAPPDQ